MLDFFRGQLHVAALTRFGFVISQTNGDGLRGNSQCHDVIIIATHNTQVHRLHIHQSIHVSSCYYIYVPLRLRSGRVMRYLLNLEFSICGGVVGGHEPLLETLDSLLAHLLLQRHTAEHNPGNVISSLIRNSVASVRDTNSKQYNSSMLCSMLNQHSHSHTHWEFADVPFTSLTVKDKHS